MADLPCADRCAYLAGAIARQSRTALEERANRLAIGLTPVYVPLFNVTPIDTVAICTGCGQVYRGRNAARDAADCVRYCR